MTNQKREMALPPIFFIPPKTIESKDKQRYLIVDVRLSIRWLKTCCRSPNTTLINLTDQTIISSSHYYSLFSSHPGGGGGYSGGLLGGGGGGIFLGILGGGVSPGSPNPEPKNVIFHIRFKTQRWSQNATLHVYIKQKLCHHCWDQNRNKKISWNPFGIRILHFLSYSFGIEMTTTLTHNRSSFVNHTRFGTKVGKIPREPPRGKICTRFQTKTAQKPYPFERHIPKWLL